MTKIFSEKLIHKVASKKVLSENSEALKFFEGYEAISDVIEQIDIALGKKSTFQTDTGSTLSLKINHGNLFTTTS